MTGEGPFMLKFVVYGRVYNRCGNCFLEWTNNAKKTSKIGVSNDLQKRPMKQYSVETSFKRIVIDVTRPIAETNAVNKYVLVVMDYFSK